MTGPFGSPAAPDDAAAVPVDDSAVPVDGPTVPVDDQPAAPARRRSSERWIWAATIVVLALVVGGAIGYVVALPSRNARWGERDELARQIDETQRQRQDLEQRRNSATAAASKLQVDVATAKSKTSSDTSASDSCSRAATDATALIAQYANVVGDARSWVDQANRGIYDDALAQHIDSQLNAMDAQFQVVGTELYSCQQAVNT